jgi:hypothetical protein
MLSLHVFTYQADFSAAQPHRAKACPHRSPMSPRSPVENHPRCSVSADSPFPRGKPSTRPIPRPFPTLLGLRWGYERLRRWRRRSRLSALPRGRRRFTWDADAVPCGGSGSRQRSGSGSDAARDRIGRFLSLEIPGPSGRTRVGYIRNRFLRISS